MKRILRKTLSSVCIAACVLSAACLDDETGTSRTGGSDGQGVPSNDVIDSRVFEVIDLDYPGLEQVRTYYRQNRYYFAAQELLDYFRVRTARVHPDIDLFAPTISATDQAYADYAFSANKYRFYVPNYWENKDKLMPYSYQAADKSIDWTYWPTAQNEQRYQLHRHYWFEMQGRAFRITGSEQYAQSWMEVYGDWIARNPRPDVELDYSIDPSKQPSEYRNAAFAWRPLEVAHRVEDQTGLMHYFATSTSLTPEWFSKFLVAFSEQADYLMRFQSAAGNHLVTQASGLFYAGMLCPEFAHAQEWYDEGARILNREITDQFHTDGMLKELDLSYHLGEIDDFYRAMRLAEVNRETPFTPTYLEQMPKLTNIVMDLTYPDYTIPNMGDTRNEGKQSVMKRNFKRYSEFFPDNAAMAWRASEGQSGAKPDYLTALYPVSGYYVLRTGWDKSDAMMILKNGPAGVAGNYHNQPDNGTFELYIAGRNFFPDSGCFAYSGDSETNRNRNWFRSTRLHNTLTLGEEDDADVTKNDITTQQGRLLLSENRNGFDVLVTENPGYPTLTHRRAIFFGKELIVIVDEGVGTAEGPVNVNYHLCDAKTSVTVDPAAHAARTSFADGNNISLQVFGNAALTSKQFAGKYSVNIGKSADRWGLTTTMIKPADAAARFITVIASGSLAGAELTASFVGDYDPAGAACTLTAGGTTYDLAYTLE